MYYTLQPAVDTKETGNAYPAVESYDDYDFGGKNSVHKIKVAEFCDNPDIRFKLATGARLCDLMGQATISVYGLLVSEKLKEILQTLSIVSHKFYPANIESQGVFHKYYWLHLVWREKYNYVDFQNTKFNINEFGTVLETIPIGSYSELIEKQKQLGVIKSIYPEKIVMRNPEFDVWPNPINTGIFVSKTTRQLLELNKVTGVLFKENEAILFT